MIPLELFAAVVLALIAALGVVVLQRDRARQQVADLLAGVCTCTTEWLPCPSHRAHRWERRRRRRVDKSVTRGAS